MIEILTVEKFHLLSHYQQVRAHRICYIVNHLVKLEPAFMVGSNELSIYNQGVSRIKSKGRATIKKLSIVVVVKF